MMRFSFDQIFHDARSTLRRFPGPLCAACLLMASLCFSLGCYDTERVTKAELSAQTEQTDVTVRMKDSLEFKFLKYNYQIHGDTLSGFGVRKSGMSTEIVRDARLSFADIASIESRVYNLRSTILLYGTGAALGFALVRIAFPY